MITCRRRIANKLKRVKNFILNEPRQAHMSVEEHHARYDAVAALDRLRISALYDPDWKWQGFESEVAWARNYLGTSEAR
jgi:hypothetical protein